MREGALDAEQDGRLAAAARQFARNGVDCIRDIDIEDAMSLVNDELRACPAANIAFMQLSLEALQ